MRRDRRVRVDAAGRGDTPELAPGPLGFVALDAHEHVVDVRFAGVLERDEVIPLLLERRLPLADAARLLRRRRAAAAHPAATAALLLALAGRLRRAAAEPRHHARRRHGRAVAHERGKAPGLLRVEEAAREKGKEEHRDGQERAARGGGAGIHHRVTDVNHGQRRDCCHASGDALVTYTRGMTRCNRRDLPVGLGNCGLGQDQSFFC